MRVAAYCRFSSEGQRDGYSIEAQLHAIREYCSREGHELIATYIDEARSGTSDDREEFQRLFKDAPSHLFQAVVVHKLDRFARDRYDSAIYRKKLKDANVRLLSVLERLDDSPESVMMESVLEGMAEYYSKNLSREVRKGKVEAARQGKHNGGQVPFGFRVDDDGRYQVIPEQALIIREIFKRRETGMTFNQIARQMRDMGYRMPSGVIDANQCRKMIMKPIYKGDLVYGLRGRNGFPVVKAEGVVEPIVTSELWERANEVSNQTRRPHPIYREKDRVYLLTGHAYCAYCGGHVKGFKSTKTYRKNNETLRKYISFKYRCSHNQVYVFDKFRYEDKKPCELKMRDKDSLEEFVIGSIKANIFNSEGLLLLIQSVQDQLAKRTSGPDPKLKSLRKDADKLKSQKDRLLDLYLEGSLDKTTYQERIHSIDGRLQLLVQEIDNLTMSTSTNVNMQSIAKAIEAFNKSGQADTYEFRRRLLATFIDKIMISNEGIEVIYKLPFQGSSSYKDYFVSNKAHVETVVSLSTKFSNANIVSKDYRPHEVASPL